MSLLAADVLPSGITKRWTDLRYHPVQHRFFLDRFAGRVRFQVCPAGRRSGKTEHAKRGLIACALVKPRARFGYCAPTYGQAKRIAWQDLKEMVPPWALATPPLEGELTIRLRNLTEIVLVGLDKPARIEGAPWDGLVIDEVANVRKDAWEANIRPALSDRKGWATFIGVPEGRNHFWRLYQRGVRGDRGWAAYTWVSADILDADEIAQAREDLSPDLFAQEFEASFVNQRGRAYKGFRLEVHAAHRLRSLYNPRAPLAFCFDFNVAPGAAVVCQELRLPNGEVGTAVLGEVHIPYDSDTVQVCRALTREWEGHEGWVEVYGDATGGRRQTSALEGSDWALVRRELRRTFPHIRWAVKTKNPPPRDRINAVNTRLLSASGRVRMLFDSVDAPETCADMEGVMLHPDGSGDPDERSSKTPERGHWGAALGYYIERRFPLRSGSAVEVAEVRMGG